MHDRHSSNRMIAVYLDADFDFSLRVLDGIQQYARRESDWRILPVHGAQDSLLAAFLERGLLAGVVGALLSDQWLEGLPGRRVPMVNFSDRSDILAVSSVISDNCQVGRLAARHLLAQGLRSFGLLVEHASTAAVRRGEGFVAALGAEGHDVSRPPVTESLLPDAGWDAWLDALPRPCGVFCASDYLARRLLRRIRARGARTPEDFALVGVGNEPLDTLLAEVPLTSIQLDAQRIGGRAAARLAALLADPGLPPACETVPPSKLVPRASSVGPAGEDPLVARALARQRLDRPEPGRELARCCGASRRTLELRFRKSLGCGPATALRRRRMDHAALLLRETRLPLAGVAEAAGYAGSASFSAAFRQAFGMPPGAWRRHHQTISMQSP